MTIDVEKIAERMGANDWLEKRRRVMRSLKIEEVSAVDKPANEHAKALILKRDDEGNKDTPMTFNEAAISRALKSVRALKAAKSPKTPEQRITKQLSKVEAFVKNERRPGETVEQARARFWTSPEGIEARNKIAKAQGKPEFRGDDMKVLEGGPAAISPDAAYASLRRKAADLQEKEPALTSEQAFVRVSNEPENRGLWLATRRRA